MEKINVDNYESFLLDYAEGVLAAPLVEELKTFLVLHPELEIDLEQMELPHLVAENVKMTDADLLKKPDLSRDEELILSYLEGELNDDEKQTLETRIKTDKVFASLLEDFKKTILLPEKEIVFPAIESLHRSVEELPDFASISYLENTLSDIEKTSFESRLKNNQALKVDLELLRNTVLQPDLAVVFPDKQSLKKKSRVIFLFQRTTLLRVAAALIFLCGFYVLLNLNSGSEKKVISENPKSKTHGSSDHKDQGTPENNPAVQADVPAVASKKEQRREAPVTKNVMEQSLAREEKTVFAEKDLAEAPEKKRRNSFKEQFGKRRACRKSGYKHRSRKSPHG